MTMLSTTAWMVHDIGLASAFGGGLFGKMALEPAVGEVSDEKERVRVEDRAWKRFSVWNNLGLLASGVTWFVGRKLLSGREASRTARGLTIAKDALVGGSLGVAVAATVVGRLLARAKEGPNPSGGQKLQSTVDVLGDVQLGLTAGILALTSMLAMEGSKSAKVSLLSRLLP